MTWELENDPKICCLLDRTSLVRSRATITNMPWRKLRTEKKTNQG